MCRPLLPPPLAPLPPFPALEQFSMHREQKRFADTQSTDMPDNTANDSTIVGILPLAGIETSLF